MDTHRFDQSLAMSLLAVMVAATSVAGCSQKVADSPGDPDLAKPSAAECQIARAAITAVHAARQDVRWRSGPDATGISVRTTSQVINPADFPGYSDDEESNLLGKGPADWRWCAGMESFLTGLGWKPMGSDQEQELAALGLGRPAVNAAGDEAKVYETISAPVGGGMKLAAGPWVATLRRGPNGWTVTSTDAAKKS